MPTGPTQEKPPPAKESDVIVVDLGSKKRKQVKQLRKGRGKLMDRVKQCLEELKATGAVSGTLVPVVIIVEQKSEAADLFGMMRS